MPIELPPTGFLLLWTAAGLVVLWTCLPSVLEWLGCRRIYMEGVDDPGAAEPGDEPTYAAVAAELKALGFEPVGVKTTRMWFTGFRWTKTFRVYLFGTRSRDVFAAVFRLVPDEPWRLAFTTAFTDGALVQSANQLNGLKIEHDDYLRWGSATVNRTELLHLHRDVSEQFRAKGNRTVAPLSSALYAELDRRHSENVLNRDFKHLPLQCLSYVLMHLLPLALLLGVQFGFGSVLVPAAVIAGGLFHLVTQARVFGQAAARLRTEDRQEGARGQMEKV
jgi:hypothetical protein